MHAHDPVTQPFNNGNPREAFLPWGHPLLEERERCHAQTWGTSGTFAERFKGFHIERGGKGNEDKRQVMITAYFFWLVSCHKTAQQNRAASRRRKAVKMATSFDFCMQDSVEKNPTCNNVTNSALPKADLTLCFGSSFVFWGFSNEYQVFKGRDCVLKKCKQRKNGTTQQKHAADQLWPHANLIRFKNPIEHEHFWTKLAAAAPVPG